MYILICGLILGQATFAQRFTSQNHVLYLHSNSNLFELSGHITESNFPSDSVRIYLYREQIQGGVELVDSIYSFGQKGVYSFSRMVQGNYYIKAVGSNKHHATYYGDSPVWVKSSAIVLRQNMKNRDINLLQKQDLNGLANLSGNVSYGETSLFHSPGDPAENVKVYLLQNNQVVACANTNPFGNYTFSGIPLLSYSIYVDLPGKSTSGSKVVFNSSKKTIEKLNFKIETSTIEVTGSATSTNTSLMETKEVQVYPNPFTRLLHTTAEGRHEITIIDFTGKEIFKKTGINESVLELDNLLPGVYLMRIEANGTHRVMRITKQ
jgi:hypothetical protein